MRGLFNADADRSFEESEVEYPRFRFIRPQRSFRGMARTEWQIVALVKPYAAYVIFSGTLDECEELIADMGELFKGY